MTTAALDSYFKTLLDMEGFASIDDSQNGLQVDNDGGEVQKIAFAVDACRETIERAKKCGAGMLFVHHGLLWGKPLRVSGVHRERLRLLLAGNVALYGVHLPLDQSPSVGNNAVLASLLGIVDPEPFGTYHGRKIGYKGRLARALTIERAAELIRFGDRPSLGVYPFGPRESVTCAVVSGGAAFESLQAIEEGIDLYVTGETSHSVYHHALEGRLNVIAGGHYSTEVWGVRRVMENCAEETGLEVEFLDVPTGL